jgi:hypothetical protein
MYLYPTLLYVQHKLSIFTPPSNDPKVSWGPSHKKGEFKSEI